MMRYLMKGCFKRVVICAVMIVCIASSFLTGCSIIRSTSKNGITNIVFCTIGEELKDNKIVLDKINEKLNAELKVNLQIEYLNMDNYNLAFSSGDEFDIIFAPDFLSYWDNASKGAFAEITDEDLQQYAPFIAKQDEKYINAGNLKGKRYAIASCDDFVNKRCYLVRGDLMDKYGIESIDSIDDFGEYLDAIAKNEPDLIPYDLPGTHAWVTAAMFVNNLGWVAPGENNASSPIFVSLYDDKKKIFAAIDTPEMRSFSYKMKEWREKGYWSKNAMSNKIDPTESFSNGRSAATFSNLQTINSLYNEFQKDDRKSWDIRGYAVYNKVSTRSSSMIQAVAISNASGNKEKALQTLNMLYSDKELYRLFVYGLEGIQYEEVEPGVRKTLDTTSYYIASGIGYKEYDMTEKMIFPGADKILQDIKNAYVEDSTINFQRDLSTLTEIEANLNNVFLKYTAPRFLGFVDDVDQAISVERQKLKEAGIDEYISSVQTRLDEYMKENNH